LAAGGPPREDFVSFDALSSFDQINLAETTFQAAIVLAFAAAHVGARRQLQRPALAALAGFWMVMAAAAIVNIASSWTGAMWGARTMSRALTSVVVALGAAAVPFAAGAIDAMRSGTRMPSSRGAALRWFAVVLVVHATGVFTLGALLPEQRVFAVTYSRSLGLAIAIVPAWLAWRALRDWRGDTGALRLLALGLSALAARRALEFALGLRVGLPNLAASAAVRVLVVDVLLIMAMGALSLLAVTAEALRVEQQQAADLQRAQARLAEGERLESLGLLAAGISHDFNNVLQVAMIVSAQLRAKVADAGLQEYLTQLDASTIHGRDLVRQLLDFARPSPSSAARCDASERLRAITEVLGHLLPSTIVLALNVPDEALPAAVESSAFEQVAVNLVTNARDAMLAGGRVKVTLARETLDGARAAQLQVTAGGYVRLTVSDTGTGIPPELLPRLFEPFFTTKPGRRGTGLGLATVHRIALKAGGCVVPSSVVDQGTTFDVYFPAA